MVKIFDIIALLLPTQNRYNTLSILVKDPESFELDEGALLYTRQEICDKNYNDERHPQVNETIESMFWDG